MSDATSSFTLSLWIVLFPFARILLLNSCLRWGAWAALPRGEGRLRKFFVILPKTVAPVCYPQTAIYLSEATPRWKRGTRSDLHDPLTLLDVFVRAFGTKIMLEAGSQLLPGFRLTQRLGMGAFGEVWEAQDPDGKLVALKFIDCRTKPNTLISSEIRVLRGLSELNHPNVIQLYGVYATSRYIVLNMERADGNLEDLRQAYIEETGRNIPSDHVLEMLGQAAAALDFLAELKLPGINLSSRGLQHCDIKPSNLLMVGDCVKIADFGLCAGTSWQTHRNGWRGTHPYAAPELYKGQATVGTDQYALCITFLKLCTGDRPFWKNEPANAPPSGLPVDLTKLREREVPIITRALHPQPGSRWPSCRAFIEAVRNVVQASRPPITFHSRGPRPMLRCQRSG
jgi:serine/threonine protein kinase, bacterial